MVPARGPVYAHALCKNLAPGGVAACLWGNPCAERLKYVTGELQKLDLWEQPALVKAPPCGGAASVGQLSVVSYINAGCTSLGGGPEARVYYPRTWLNTTPAGAELRLGSDSRTCPGEANRRHWLYGAAPRE